MDSNLSSDLWNITKLKITSSSEKNEVIKEKNEVIKEKNEVIKDKNEVIKDKNEIIKDKKSVNRKSFFKFF